jgi:hypothetical protein
MENMTDKHWRPEEAYDDTKVKCRFCGKSHPLVQGKITNIRIGDGILFYICGKDQYVGAINHKTVFGVEVCP